MPDYPELIASVLGEEKLLGRLLPAEPLDWQWPKRVQAANDAALAGGRVIGDTATFALVRGGLLYALDALDAAHRIFQEQHCDLASYWHGMLHRREGDFDNARYWFRRAGALPFFAGLHRAACGSSAEMARQANWDPYLFTGQCEQARFGAELGPELLRLLRAEFDAVFDYSWRQASVAPLA